MSAEVISWEEIWKLRSAKPFRPFFVDLKSGKTVEVLEALWCGGNETAGTFGVCHPKTGARLYRKEDVVGLRTMSDNEIADRERLRDHTRKRAS